MIQQRLRQHCAASSAHDRLRPLRHTQLNSLQIKHQLSSNDQSPKSDHEHYNIYGSCRILVPEHHHGWTWTYLDPVDAPARVVLGITLSAGQRALSAWTRRLQRRPIAHTCVRANAGIHTDFQLWHSTGERKSQGKARPASLVVASQLRAKSPTYKIWVTPNRL